jgi:hypothetical protein
VKVIIDICTLTDYSVAKEHQKFPLERLWCFSSSIGVALSEVRVKLSIAQALKSSLQRSVSACIFTFLFRFKYFNIFILFSSCLEL